jgi:hypothetical protein
MLIDATSDPQPCDEQSHPNAKMKAKYLVLPAALFALSIVAHGDGFGNVFGVAFSIDPSAFNGGQRQQQQPRREEHHTRPTVKTAVTPDKVTPLPMLSAAPTPADN